MGKINLQLFADGAEGAAAEAGTQADANDGQVAAAVKTPDELKAEFQKLIKGEYKDAYTDATQSVINKRFRETKTLEEARDKLSPVLANVYKRFGVNDGDLDALSAALDNDEAYINHVAMRDGVSEDEARARLQAENRDRARDIKLQQLEAEKTKREKADRERAQFDTWYHDAEKLKDIYPSMDFAAEMQNKDFVSLLASGVPVKTAFEVTHINDVLGGAMAHTASKVAEGVANSIKANGSRPAENGTTSSAAVVTKPDVNKLGNKDIMDILKRVSAGEHIEL